MSVQLCLNDLRNAYKTQDPKLGAMIAALAFQKDPEPETPVREQALSFDKFIREIRSKEFRKKTLEEQYKYRIEQVKALESPDVEIPLPDRLKLHEIILELWEDNSPFARTVLLNLIAQIHLTYGPWRALKQIAKQAEAREDTEILGALGARFDTAFADGNHDISPETLGYMCRRIWRYLRRLGQSFPVAYADAAVDMLKCYTDKTQWSNTWIANHILFHNTKKYSRQRFINYHTSVSGMLKNRAYPKLWQRTYRPLLSLLERAGSRHVKKYAVAALKNDFKAQIRDIDVSWIPRLISTGDEKTDEFVIWLLSNVPRFEQAAFRDLGIHDFVLRLFDSKSKSAKKYAAEYARTHARDMEITLLIRLLNNNEKAVRELAKDLVLDRDPKKDIGLDAWGRLLETSHGHDFAAKMIQKHFTAGELTPDWFCQRILSDNFDTYYFAIQLLPKIHPVKKLGPGYFCDIINSIEKSSYSQSYYIADFVFKELAKFNVNELDTDFLKKSIIHPGFSHHVLKWIQDGRLLPSILGVEFFKTLAFHPDWEKSKWADNLRKSGVEWAKDIGFNDYLSGFSMNLLKDARVFKAKEIGFDWLMNLTGRGELRYHDFAVSLMVKSFIPADFALEEDKTKTEGEIKHKDIAVDFKGASFIFTGKLSTMTRKEALDKVAKTNGKKASGITKNLDYLVIGDEGSPFYGHGRKGSKQLKAESLIEKGAEIKIISETAFLQMLSGKAPDASEDAQVKGCQRLWEMIRAQGEEDDPFARFAMTYFLRHHPGICLAETDRPVDPGAEIPESFLSFERILPLFSDERSGHRKFALELAEWELARWSPDSGQVVRLCAAHYKDVRAFIIHALTAEDDSKNRRFRLDAKNLGPDAVFGMCESYYADIRRLGMLLIGQNNEYWQPDKLFALTESQDRQIRAFAVRTLWTLYRDKGITLHWNPDDNKSGDKKQVSRPGELPGSHDRMRDLLRRILFEIPPGRIEKQDIPDNMPQDMPGLKPLPLRKAKLCLVETLRDIAVEDQSLAEAVLPLLEEFMESRGMSEQASCLVAVTRIQNAHPHLSGDIVNYE